jgi:hypothetical protein
MHTINLTEAIMKKHTTIVMAMMAAVFFSGIIAEARTPSLNSKLEYAKKNLLIGIRSTNQGLVESAMMQVAKVKIAYRASDFAEVKDVIDSLSVNANNPSIRYRAYLASNVCDNPTWFAKEDYAREQNVNKFYESVAEELQARVIGSRTN